MPTFTRPRRQALATLTVFALTIAPTAGVIWTAWRVNRPGHVRDVEIELGRALGLQVSLESVRYPRPGETVFEGIVLRREEPGRKTFREIARADRLRARRADRELVLETVGLRLRAESPRQSLDEVAAMLRQRRSAETGWDRLTLIAPTCAVEPAEAEKGNNGARFDVRELAATFEADRGLPTLTASFRFGDRPGEAGRCEATLTRDSGVQPPRTTLTIDTKEGAPLPARALDPFFNADDWLGPDARVWGSLSLSRSGDAGDWEAVFRGDLIDVDLAALVAGHYPDQHLSGRARVNMRSARWGALPGRRGLGWVGAEGELHAGAGAIGREFLRGLADRLRFQVDPALEKDNQREDLRFDKLGLSFALKTDGQIDFKGALGPETAPNAVLTDVDHPEPIVFAPQGASGVVGLINTLVPPVERAVLVPGTRESQQLQQYLPLPDAPAVSRAHAN